MERLRCHTIGWSYWRHIALGFQRKTNPIGDGTHKVIPTLVSIWTVGGICLCLGIWWRRDFGWGKRLVKCVGEHSAIVYRMLRSKLIIAVCLIKRFNISILRKYIGIGYIEGSIFHEEQQRQGSVWRHPWMLLESKARLDVAHSCRLKFNM